MTFTRNFTAQAGDIDELGHVNNAVWVRWVQDMAGAHWAAVAPPEHQAAYVWVIVRHEIDYRGNLVAGESVTAETWVGEPKGAKFDRFVRFVKDGKVLVEAKTTWALIDRASGRLLRVTREIAAPFTGLAQGAGCRVVASELGQSLMTYRYTKLASPIGGLTLIASDDALAAILFADQGLAAFRRGSPERDDGHPVLREAARQLTEYFAGERTTFDLPLEFGGTDFQRSVWDELLRIPAGQTRSYADVAQAIGRPTATRAVGAANGRNPLPIVAPCHRVIGKDGSLTGFGGGLPVKEKLLALEGVERLLS